MKKSLVLLKTAFNNLSYVYLSASVTIIFCCLSVETNAEANLKEAEKAIRMRQFERAFELYLQQAKAGDSEAQYQLGNLYLLGIGVGASENSAMLWLQKAADQNHPAAQYNLALKIIDRDVNVANKLIRQAADRGYQPAITYSQRTGELGSTKLNDADSLIQRWFAAARNDQVDVLDSAKNIIHAIDVQDENGRTALFVATESGSYDSVNWLLEQKSDPNLRDSFGLSPLFVAIRGNQLKILQRLLVRGGDPTSTLVNGDTLLHYAVRLNHQQLVPVLVQYGVTLSQANLEGWTALDLAQYSEADSIVKQLLESGAKQGDSWRKAYTKNSQQRNANGLTTAAKNPNELAKVIVSGNVDIFNQISGINSSLLNKQLTDGTNLLSLAIKRGDDDMVSALLKAGADSNQITYGRKTAIHVAATGSNASLVKLLLDRGADPLIKTDDQLDAVDIAIQSSQSNTAVILLDYLLQKKKNAPFDHYLLIAVQFDLQNVAEIIAPHISHSSTDSLGRNALWFAAKSKNTALIPLLIEHGISSSEADAQGKTPFHVAIEASCITCAEILLTATNINQQTISGNTPLLIASTKGNQDMVAWLIKQGADLEVRNAQGTTALIASVQANSVDSVKMLLEAGANVTRKNKLGFSAVDIAEESNKEIYQLLKAKSLFGIF